MDQFKFTNCIKNKQDKATIDLIGNIDIIILESYKAESVFYSLPLIERMILEIYKFVPMADIEKYEQGEMRTMLELIKNNNYNGEEIIPNNVVEMVKEIFDENGIRNNIFHVKDVNIEVGNYLNRINYIIMMLLEVLKLVINQYSTYRFVNIEKLI